MGHHPDHRGTDASTQKNQPDDLPKAQAPPWTPSKRNSAERESFLAEMPSEKMVTGPVLYGTQPRYLALAGTDGAMEAAMAFRIADIGNEAQLVELGERLSKALSSAQHRTDLLDFSPEYLDAAKTMLAELSGEV